MSLNSSDNMLHDSNSPDLANQPGPDTHVMLQPLPDETLPALLQRRASESPDEVYCTFNGTDYTIGMINQRANQLANLLYAQGVRPGEHVALMLPSHPNHLIAIFALAKLGAVRIPINIHLIGAPLHYAFSHLQPTVLLADRAYRDVLDTLPEKPATVLWTDTASDGGTHDVFEDSHSQPATPPPVPAIAPDDIIALTPSSGTTGAPKGVLKSDRHMRAGPHTVLRITEAGPGDVFLFWESLHHGAGVAVAIAALMGGFRLAMVERFSASRFWDDARRFDVTHVHYLGSVLAMLLNQPPRPDDREHDVRIAWGGGCSPETWQAFSERFGVQMRQGYGLSELLTFVTLNIDGPAGSIGKPLSWYDIKLVDDTGQTVTAGEHGELLFRSREPGMQFLGYFRSPEQTQETMNGNWLCTGDLAYANDHGHHFYAGRKKEMLRRRGINISAWEVEQVFASHPQIEEAALIGVPSDLGEDELKLFVRTRNNQPLDPLELIRWSESRLPYFQIPRYIAFIDAFPKTPTQRTQKKELSRATENVWDLQASGHQPARKR